MRSIGHFIDGRIVAGASGRHGDVYDPNTGRVQAQVALATAEELDRAVASAAAAQPGWAKTNPQRRARVMFEFKRLLEAHMDELAHLLSSEHGKVLSDARGDIQRGLEVIEFACGIPHLLKGEYTQDAGPGIDVYSMRQPLGVVAGITPFNFPAMIPMWMFGPAIASGNAFILKPSERDPSVPLRLAELLIEAGLPPGVLNVVQGDKDVVGAILRHPDIRAVSFVGSSDIAQHVYAQGAAHGKRVQCMGGAKNHGIVLPDADLDRAVADILARGRPVIGVGGTALYIKGLLCGLFDGPGSDETIRNELRQRVQVEGSARLHAELAVIDPTAADRINPNDTRRIIRAMEVYRLTGRPISSFQTQFDTALARREDSSRESASAVCAVKPATNGWTLVGLRRDKAEESRRINTRARGMIESGLVEEVRGLLAEDKPLSQQARAAIGYAEIIEHLAGRLTLDEALEQIKVNTRRLAKGQRTWFRTFPNVHWLDVAGDESPEHALSRAESVLFQTQ